MELALISGKQVLCILVLMIVGFLCVRCHILDREANSKLSALLLNVVTPAMILLSYQREYNAALARGLILSFGLSVLAIALSILLCGLVFPAKGSDRRWSLERFGGIYGNTGFLGIPLVNGVFGSEGVFYLTAFITAFNLIAWTHGVMLMQGKFDKKAFLNGLLSPTVISIFVGVALFFGRITLPEVIVKPVGYLSDLNTGLAMLVAGVSLAGTNLKALREHPRILLVSAMRLLVCPIAFGLLLMLLPIAPIIRGTMLLASACPTATILIMFSYRFGGDDLYATQIFAVTTVLCALTIPIVMLLA